MFYNDGECVDIIDFFKRVAEIKSNEKNAYVVYDDEWIEIMDKDELEQFAADQIDSVDDLDCEDTPEQLRSLDLSDLASIKKILELRCFEMIEI